MGVAHYALPSMRRGVLIISASMGAGHDGAARELRKRLESRGHDVTVVDFLTMMPFKLGAFCRWTYETQLKTMPWSYELSYKALGFAGSTSLFRFFGYFGLFCATVLIMRVLVAILRDGLN